MQKRVVKASKTKNPRHGVKPQSAYTPIKEFFNPQNSEVVAAGRWLINAFSA